MADDIQGADQMRIRGHYATKPIPVSNCYTRDLIMAAV
jgi:hypothetical protein